jgi:hypothetical protein
MMDFDPLRWLVGVYAPHFLRRAGFSEHARTLEKMQGRGEWVIAEQSEEVRQDVGLRHEELVVGKLARLPDDDPARELAATSWAAVEIWTIADRAAEIAIAEGHLTLDELRAERQRLFDQRS